VDPVTPVKRSPREEGLAVIGVLVMTMWLLEVVDTIDHHKLDQYGIEPRDADGLIGIVAAPFLHAGFGHLIGNTVPFVTGIVALVSGLGVWLIGPEHTNHIGASGIVFGYATYLMTRGFYNRSALEIVVGIVIFAIFGTALLGGLAPQEGISWQGHLFGAIGGVIAARLLTRDRDRGPDARRPLPA
jgi:membrane associated rhomboid family serine protease